MVGILPERQVIERRFFRRLLLAGLLLSPCIGFAQAASESGSQSAASAVHFQILDQGSVSFGKHTVTFNRVAPPGFPPSVAPPSPAPPPQLYAKNVLLCFFATVYDGKLTLIQWSSGDQTMVALSNINGDYLSTLYGFAEGNTAYEIIAFVDNESSTNADPQIATWLKQAQNALSASVPGYVIVSGTADGDTLQGFDALHAYFGANKNTLAQVYAQKQAQWAAEQLQLKQHPPVRPNTVINFWPIKSSVYPTGANQ
jgi:hypothetical protein